MHLTVALPYLCYCKVVLPEPVEEQQTSVKPENAPSQEEQVNQAVVQNVIPEEKEAPAQSETTEIQEDSCSTAEKQSTETQRAVSKASGASKLTRQKKADVSESNIEREEESATKDIPQLQDDPKDADYTPS